MGRIWTRQKPNEPLVLDLERFEADQGVGYFLEQGLGLTRKLKSLVEGKGDITLGSGTDVITGVPDFGPVVSFDDTANGSGEGEKYDTDYESDEELTVSFWLYVTSTPTNYDCILFQSNSAWTGGWGLYHYPSDTNIYCFQSHYANDRASVPFSITTDDRKWLHLCFTTDGSTIKLYKNGVLGTTDTANQAAGDQGFRVMRAGSYESGGYLDNLILFRRTFSHQEVLDLYTHPFHYLRPLKSPSRSFVVSPTPAGLDLTVDTLNALALTGLAADQAITTNISVSLDDPGVLALQTLAADVEISTGLQLTADPGILTVTGIAGDVEITTNINASLDVPGVLSLTGIAADFTIPGNIDASLDVPGIVALTGIQADVDISLNRTYEAIPGTLALEGITADAVITGIEVEARKATGGRHNATYRYPRRVKFGDDWREVQSFEEEMRLIQDYLANLEAEKLVAVEPKTKEKIQGKIRYNRKKIRALRTDRERMEAQEAEEMVREAERKRAITDHNNRMILDAVFKWPLI